MLRSRLFWKLFLGFTLVNLLTAAALVSATWFWQRGHAITLAEAELATAAELLIDPATLWAAEPNDTHANQLRKLAKRAKFQLRIRRKSDGQLLVVAPTEGFLPTTTLRVSRPLEVDRHPVGNLWVERSTTGREATFAKLWTSYAMYVPLVGLVMIAAGYGSVAHLIGPVRSLTRVATAMSAGQYGQRTFVANQDELGTLAKLFDTVSAEIGQRLSELQQSDRRQATVLGGMIEGVVAMEDDQRVLFANPAAGKLFGFLPPEVVGRPLLEVVRNHPLHQAANAAIETQTPQRLEINWDQRVLSVQITPITGETGGAIVVLHDTTELRRLETLRRDFVANVSHELKTPLSTIKASAETLLRGAVDDKEHRTKFLTGIGEQSERLEDLIHDMLNLARIEAAQQPFKIDLVTVGEAVAACIEDYAPRAEAKHIDLALTEVEGAAGAQVRADRQGLRVILGNLVDNAIKYTPEGGQVRIRWQPVLQGKASMIRIEVADDGVGIPEGKLSRVFERFFRVDEARSRELGGTGLGLSIVKHLAQSFGGRVSVENRSGGGAIFAVTLLSA